jgi:hypothetical protein
MEANEKRTRGPMLGRHVILPCDHYAGVRKGLGPALALWASAWPYQRSYNLAKRGRAQERGLAPIFKPYYN